MVRFEANGLKEWAREEAEKHYLDSICSDFQSYVLQDSPDYIEMVRKEENDLSFSMDYKDVAGEEKRLERCIEDEEYPDRFCYYLIEEPNSEIVEMITYNLLVCYDYDIVEWSDDFKIVFFSKEKKNVDKE